jgi:hypothetical protein
VWLQPTQSRAQQLSSETGRHQTLCNALYNVELDKAVGATVQAGLLQTPQTGVT